ncbi:hypothetical protein D3C86_2095000 [compost metagenome]
MINPHLLLLNHNAYDPVPVVGFADNAHLIKRRDLNRIPNFKSFPGRSRLRLRFRRCFKLFL